MKLSRILLSFLIVALFALSLYADGSVGIYAMVQKVVFEPSDAKPDPRTLLNCNILIPADQGFCIARNEIILECRKPGKYPDFDACISRLISRQQQPRVAECPRTAAGQQNACALRNKYLTECFKDPWLYFMCLGENMSVR